MVVQAAQVKALTPPSGPWRVAGASVQGTAHARRDLPCQDAYRYRVLADGGLLVAVGDGAGSARLSQLGSNQAVAAGLEGLQAGLAVFQPQGQAEWQQLLWHAFSQAYRAVRDLARSERHRLRDYATTLTLAIVSGGWLVAGQIGDGAVVAETTAGHLLAATRAQKGEYANETHFLTERNAHKFLNVQALQTPVTSLAVMSDGLLRLALQLPSGEPFPPFFQPLFRFVAQSGPQGDDQLAGFLSSERVCARSDDDKTLVLAARVNGGRVA